MNAKVLLAVLKRNFVSYFASPTGYVFICLFVALSTVAAFWPHEFFNANLANLDQLNKMFPFIMLVFIPAISMAVWANERRQGTDELLLTVPAGDLDIVLGKYLAAVAIYTVSLLFSLACNFIVLGILGNPDAGLFWSTYIGYWLVGLAMLAVGMVASFLTSDLTVAYILGVIFNLPLVFVAFADAVLPTEAALAVKQWSIGERFTDFGRGILSFSGWVYFSMIVVVMLYLCMVLIGRRHWVRGLGGLEMVGHFATRTVALAVITMGAIVLTTNYDARVDVTEERLSSLSPETVSLLKGLEIKRSVEIEAFISPTVPESYAQTRIDLLSMLRELQARGGGKVTVRVYDTEEFSEEATRAEARYAITSREVADMARGSMTPRSVFLGVAFTCGLEKIILPFVDRGIPVEYELVRSIATVTQQSRKKIGILKTDAQLYGGFDMQMGGSRPNWSIIEELEKQYEVEQVDPANPITERYDALLAVQPSSLGPAEMNHFLDVVRGGQPTAIFEDPAPLFSSGAIPGTSEPRRAPGGMNPMFGGGQAPPKGNIGTLWTMLGIDFSAGKIVWQDHNPIHKLSHLDKEFVFIDEGAGDGELFNESAAVSSKLEHLLLPFPGLITKLNASNLEFTPLVRTGQRTGTVEYFDLRQMSMFGTPGGLNPNRRQQPTGTEYVLAAEIRGEVPAAPALDDATLDKSLINVVLVADCDMIHPQFFRLREMGGVPEAGILFDFDNVTFVLNALDVLADDDRFLEIRKRRPHHRTLTKIDERTKEARKKTTELTEKLREDLDEAKKEEQKRIDDNIAKLQKRLQSEDLDMVEILNRVGLAQRDAQRRMNIKIERLQQNQARERKKIETERAKQISRVQNQYKTWAVLLPPIPPLVLAVVVFFTRRRREREGVSQTRLRS